MAKATPKNARFVKELALSTGVPEADVAKVLEELGLARVYAEAVRSNKGAEPKASAAKIAFKIGRSTIVV